MIKVILSVITLCSLAFSVTLQKYDISSKDTHIDIMLAFDDVFNSQIKQQKSDSFIKIVLNNVSIKDDVEDAIDSPIVDKINIISYDNKTEIILFTPQSVNLLASKTVNGFGLRLRVKGNKSSIKKDTIKEKKDESLNTKEDFSYNKYYLIVGALTLLLAVLFIVKKFVEKSRYASKGEKANSDINLIYQKLLDDKNRFSVIEFDNIEYTLLLGNSNILLNKKDLTKKEEDIITDTKNTHIDREKKSKNANEFENILKDNGIDLENANITIKN